MCRGKHYQCSRRHEAIIDVLTQPQEEITFGNDGSFATFSSKKLADNRNFATFAPWYKELLGINEVHGTAPEVCQGRLYVRPC